MQTVVTRPKRRKKEQTEEVPDLYRDAGLFKISVTYLPDLKDPKSAFVSIQTYDGVIIDSFEVPPDRGHAVLHHPVMHSDMLHKHLRKES